MSSSSVTKSPFVIKNVIDTLIEDTVESPLRTVKSIFHEIANTIVDLSTEVRAKHTSLSKFDKKFGKEKEDDFIAKRVRTKNNLPLPVQASKEAEATAEFTTLTNDIHELDKLHQIAITGKIKELSKLEHTLSVSKRTNTFVEETIKLFEALLQGFKSRSTDFQPIVTDKHFAGWHLIKHVLDMEKPERKGMCELIGCTSSELVKSIHKLTFDRHDIENIQQMVIDHHFPKISFPVSKLILDRTSSKYQKPASSLQSSRSSPGD